MRQYKKFIIAALLGSLIILIESCASSKLVDVWKDPTYHGSQLKKVLVIAVRKNPIQRRIWEDSFTLELSKINVEATSSYHLFPNALPDTDQVIEAVQKNGFDGILITRILHSEAQTHYVPGYISTEQLTRYNHFLNKYETYYHDIDHPGYTDSLIIKRRSIDVWALGNDDRMIWSATSNSPEMNTVEAIQSDIADLVVDELVHNAIIKSGK